MAGLLFFIKNVFGIEQFNRSRYILLKINDEGG